MIKEQNNTVLDNRANSYHSSLVTANNEHGSYKVGTSLWGLRDMV